MAELADAMDLKSMANIWCGGSSPPTRISYAYIGVLLWTIIPCQIV